MAKDVTSFDCQRCGACCVNLPQNRAEGFVDYVQVQAGDRILAKPELLRRFVVYNSKDEAHLRLDREGRCLALCGALGRKVRCRIYHYRPSPCRRVQPGTSACLRHRAAFGID